MNFRNLSLTKKLSLLVWVFVLAFVAFAAVAFNTLNELKVRGPYYQKIVQGKDLVADVLPPPAYIIESYLTALQIANPQNRAQVGALKQKMQSLQTEYNKRHNVWSETLPNATSEERELRDLMITSSYNPAVRFYEVADTQLLPQVERRDYAAANNTIRGTLQSAYNEHRTAIDGVVKRANARNNALETEAKNVVGTRTVALIVLGGAIVLAMIIGIGVFLNRSIANALRETASVLSSTSSQIATAIEEHERTAMHQAAAVHQTTATMDELDASFRQTVEVVTTAADTARQAARIAEGGIQTVEQTHSGMTSLKEKVGIISDQIAGLSEQTAQIGSITSLVSDLANQTNMLALNAAVEAARAGEHGKGFGVVAGEIRKLADESKKSAERINALVGDIQRATTSTVMATEEGTKNVDASLRLAEETVRAFHNVTDSSNTASQAAQQTLLSVPQQVTAVRQVLTAMDALNTGARETADGIGQTKIGVENLRQTAIKLKEMV